MNEKTKAYKKKIDKYIDIIIVLIVSFLVLTIFVTIFTCSSQVCTTKPQLIDCAIFFISTIIITEILWLFLCWYERKFNEYDDDLGGQLAVKILFLFIGAGMTAIIGVWTTILKKISSVQIDLLPFVIPVAIIIFFIVFFAANIAFYNWYVKRKD